MYTFYAIVLFESSRLSNCIVTHLFVNSICFISNSLVYILHERKKIIKRERENDVIKSFLCLVLVNFDNLIYTICKLLITQKRDQRCNFFSFHTSFLCITLITIYNFREHVCFKSHTVFIQL